MGQSSLWWLPFFCVGGSTMMLAVVAQRGGSSEGRSIEEPEDQVVEIGDGIGFGPESDPPA